MFVFHQVLVFTQTHDPLHCRVQIMVELAFRVYYTTTRYDRTHANVDILSCRDVADGCSEYIRSASSFNF